MIFNFQKFDLKCSKDVFHLTTDATLLGALAWNDTEIKESERILEVGLGTGVISLMLMQRFPNFNLTGIDINPDSFKLAKENLENSPFNHHYEIACADILLWKGKNYNKIIINPPYFVNETPSKKDHESIAKHLSIGYDTLLSKIINLIEPNGSIEMICSIKYQELIAERLKKHHGYIERKIEIAHNKNTKPKTQIIRIKKMLDESSRNYSTEKINFNIRNLDNSFSPEYKECLEDFLTIFAD